MLYILFFTILFIPSGIPAMERDTYGQGYPSDSMLHQPGSHVLNQAQCYLSRMAVPYYGARSKKSSSHKTNGLISRSGVEIRVRWDTERDIPVFISGDLGHYVGDIGEVRLNKSVPSGTEDLARADVAASYRFLSDNREIFKIVDPSADLSIVSYSVDLLDRRHVRFSQSFRKTSVWASELSIHFDGNGSIYSFNGSYEPVPEDFPLETGIEGPEAVVKAIRDLEDRGSPLDEIPEGWKEILGYASPGAYKAIWRDRSGALRLVWVVNVRPNLKDNWTYFIDASNGEVLFRLNNTAYDGPAEGTGSDLFGTSRVVNSYLLKGVYYLIDASRPMFDPYSSRLPNRPVGAIWTLSAGNTESTLSNIISGDNLWADPASVSAHFNASLVYDYYRETHGRNSIDGVGESIISIVHYGSNFDNAFWNGTFVALGDGDGKIFRPLCTALDVMAHELTHGVIENSAGLLYLSQSGALNESFADFFGAMVDRDDWLIGEDIVLPTTGAVALRDMSDPGSAGVLSKQPSHMDEYSVLPETEEGDYGGVHLNSGIPNKAAYLISDAVGKERAEKIYYRALTMYVTKNSQFVDARFAVAQAAEDLYGPDSFEVTVVGEGFNSVGITEECERCEPISVDVPPIEGKDWIAFVGSDFSPAIALAEDSSIRLKLTDAGVIHTGEVDSIYVGKLSVTRDGKTIWFVSTDGFLHYVDISDPRNMQEFYLPNLRLYSAGDIFNASISPGGDRVALVSRYKPDPNIYIAEGDSVRSYNLYSKTYTQGVESTPPRYADVVDWAPDGKLILYDALYEIGAEEVGDIRYWDFSEMELETGNIFRLIPSPPVGIDIGNPQYSSLSPTLIAYNEISRGASIDSAKIVFLDFKTNLRRELYPSGWKPSFSPDDSKIAYHRTSTDGFFDIYVRDLDSGEETLFMKDAGYPEWFAVPTTEVVEKDHGEGNHLEFCVLGNYPNPFNSETSIEYTLPELTYVRLCVYDVLGRKVAILDEGYRSAGRHEILWNGVSDDGVPLSTGIYVYSLEGGKFRGSGKMALIK